MQTEDKSDRLDIPYWGGIAVHDKTRYHQVERAAISGSSRSQIPRDRIGRLARVSTGDEGFGRWLETGSRLAEAWLAELIIEADDKQRLAGDGDLAISQAARVAVRCISDTRCRILTGFCAVMIPCRRRRLASEEEANI